MPTRSNAGRDAPGAPNSEQVSAGSHVPIRMCVACRERGTKDEFIRVGGAGTGRGAYLHRSAKCLKIAAKKNAFARALRGKVPPQIYENLEREINGE